MYGRVAAQWELKLRTWGGITHETVASFVGDPIRQLQSLERKLEYRHTLCNLLRRELKVPKKDFSDSGWKGFVNVTLTGEQKTALQAWDIQDGDIWDGIASYNETGYKVTSSFNAANKSFTATVIGGEGTGKNAGRAVSAFAPTPYQAMRTLLFKISVLLPPVWTDYKAAVGDDVG